MNKGFVIILLILALALWAGWYTGFIPLPA